MDFRYWFMFPVSILIATIAMASGVEGSTFFAPIFMLVLGLPPEVAIGTGLITQAFGSAGGLQAYHRKGLIDYRLGATLLVVTIPLALAGTWLSTRIDPSVLKLLLGVGLLVISGSFLRGSKPPSDLPPSGIRLPTAGVEWRRIVPSDGNEVWYTVRNLNVGRVITGIGSLFMGMLATGLGATIGYYMLRRCRMPYTIAVATAVFVVAITALIASSSHFVRFIQTGGDSLNTVLGLVVFTIPGVLIGARLGPTAASRISSVVLERVIGVLFIFVSILMLFDVLV